MRRFQFTVAALLAVAALGIVGCGDDGTLATPTTPDELAVVQPIETLYRALAVGNGVLACRQLTAVAQVKRAAGADVAECVDSVDPEGELTDDSPGVYGVTIHGTRAEAIVSEEFAGEGAGWRFFLEHVDGRWLVAKAELIGTTSD